MSNTIIKEMQPLTKEQKDQIKEAARSEVVLMKIARRFPPLWKKRFGAL